MQIKQFFLVISDSFPDLISVLFQIGIVLSSWVHSSADEEN